MSKRRTTTRERARAVPIGKPFPWGTVLGGGTLGVVLVGVLAYAVVNAGAAAPNPLRDADNAIQGMSVAATPPSQGHQTGPLTYDTTPSRGGPHNPVWNTCTGMVYTQQIPQENAAHSLEHGAVWVTYRPGLPADQVKRLAGLVEGTDYRLMSPFPGLSSQITLQAWGRQLKVKSASDPRVETFLKEFTNGPQAPEKGATCGSGTTATGTEPAAA